MPHATFFSRQHCRRIGLLLFLLLLPCLRPCRCRCRWSSSEGVVVQQGLLQPPERRPVLLVELPGARGRAGRADGEVEPLLLGHPQVQPGAVEVRTGTGQTPTRQHLDEGHVAGRREQVFVGAGLPGHLLVPRGQHEELLARVHHPGLLHVAQGDVERPGVVGVVAGDLLGPGHHVGVEAHAGRLQPSAGGSDRHNDTRTRKYASTRREYGMLYGVGAI